jgi:ATP-dependent Clp protease protease subunit
MPQFEERGRDGMRRLMDPYAKLFEERIIFLGVQIDDISADDVMAQLLVLVCLGQAASAAALLLSAGTAGKRFALPHARILIHQPYTEGGGQGSDIEIQANEILRMREEMEGVLARHTGRPLDEIRRDIERDKILTAEGAKEYGIIDEVLTTRVGIVAPA